MFGSLVKNNTFYILDKTNKPVLKVGKIVDSKINPQSYGLVNQELDITVDVAGETYEFKKVPSNLSIASPSVGVVISDNTEDLIKEYDAMVANSNQVLESIDYHKGIVESRDEIMTVLNPKFAKEKEQENKLSSLEDRVGNMEKGIENIISMLSKLSNTK